MALNRPFGSAGGSAGGAQMADASRVSTAAQMAVSFGGYEGGSRGKCKTEYNRKDPEARVIEGRN